MFLRTSPKPTDVTSKCYELNIADASDNPFPTGSFVERQRCQGDHDSTDWQTFDVTADGGHFVVKLDGETVLDYTDPRAARTRVHRVAVELRQGRVPQRQAEAVGAREPFQRERSQRAGRRTRR